MQEPQILERIVSLAEEHGFECVGHGTADGLRVRGEIRSICETNRCGKYGTSWACPPACGSLDHYREEIARRTWLVVFQSVGELDNNFDYTSMKATEDLQVQRTQGFVEDVLKIAPDCLVLAGTGSCQVCPECAYPDAPCRHPDKMHVSMEAAGMVFSEACELAGIPYYHGPLRMAFMGALLI